MGIVVEVEFLEVVDGCRIVTVDADVLFDTRRRFLRVCLLLFGFLGLRFCYH